MTGDLDLSPPRVSGLCAETLRAFVPPDTGGWAGQDRGFGLTSVPKSTDRVLLRDFNSFWPRHAASPPDFPGLGALVDRQTAWRWVSARSRLHDIAPAPMERMDHPCDLAVAAPPPVSAWEDPASWASWWEGCLPSGPVGPGAEGGCDPERAWNAALSFCEHQCRDRMEADLAMSWNEIVDEYGDACAGMNFVSYAWLDVDCTVLDASCAVASDWHYDGGDPPGWDTHRPGDTEVEFGFAFVDYHGPPEDDGPEEAPRNDWIWVFCAMFPRACTFDPPADPEPPPRGTADTGDWCDACMAEAEAQEFNPCTRCVGCCEDSDDTGEEPEDTGAGFIDIGCPPCCPPLVLC